MLLTITNNGFSLEGLRLQNVYDNRRYAVIIKKKDYDNFKSLAKASGFNVVSSIWCTTTPHQCIVKITLPDSWGRKITM